MKNNNLYYNNNSNENISNDVDDYNDVDANDYYNNNYSNNKSFISIDLSQQATTNITTMSSPLFRLSSSPLSILSIEEEIQQSNYFPSIKDKNIEESNNNSNNNNNSNSISINSINNNVNNDNNNIYNEYSFKSRRQSITTNPITTTTSAVLMPTDNNDNNNNKNNKNTNSNNTTNNDIVITKPASVKHRYHKVPIKTSLISNFYDFPLGTYNTISSLTDYIMTYEKQRLYQLNQNQQLNERNINNTNGNVNQKTKRNLFGGLKNKLSKRKNSNNNNVNSRSNNVRRNSI